MPRFGNDDRDKRSYEALQKRWEDQKMGDAKPLTVEHIQRVLADPDPLVNRLRGKYTTPVGERQLPTTPIQVAAAVEIDALRTRAEQAEKDRKELAELVPLLSEEAEAWVKYQGHEWDGTGYYGGVVRRLRVASAAIARAGEVKP